MEGRVRRVPDSFSARVEGTLNEMNRMEGRQTMKRTIAWRAALAAVLALAILTGTRWRSDRVAG